MSDQGPSYPQDQPPYQQPSQPPYQPPYQPPSQPPAYGPAASDQVRFQPAGPMVEHPQATLAFVLGLLSVLGLTILGPFGWYWGNKVVAEIDRDQRAYSNRGLAMAGKVLGIIGTVFLILSVVAVVVIILIAVLAAGTSTSTTTGY